MGTIVLSAIMIMKQLTGMVPEMNPIADLTGLAKNLIGAPPFPLVGWALHFFIGAVVWGTLFAVLEAKLPGADIVKGLVFGVGAWLLMMVVFQPLAGYGLFGMAIGPVVAMMALMLHLIYGAVLGFVFGWLATK